MLRRRGTPGNRIAGCARARVNSAAENVGAKLWGASGGNPETRDQNIAMVLKRLHRVTPPSFGTAIVVFPTTLLNLLNVSLSLSPQSEKIALEEIVVDSLAQMLGRRGTQRE